MSFITALPPAKWADGDWRSIVVLEFSENGKQRRLVRKSFIAGPTYNATRDLAFKYVLELRAGIADKSRKLDRAEWADLPVALPVAPPPAAIEWAEPEESA